MKTILAIHIRKPKKWSEMLNNNKNIGCPPLYLILHLFGYYNIEIIMFALHFSQHWELENMSYHKSYNFNVITQNEENIKEDVNHRIQTGWIKWRNAFSARYDGKKYHSSLKKKLWYNIRPVMLYRTKPQE